MSGADSSRPPPGNIHPDPSPPAARPGFSVDDALRSLRESRARANGQADRREPPAERREAPPEPERPRHRQVRAETPEEEPEREPEEREPEPREEHDPDGDREPEGGEDERDDDGQAEPTYPVTQGGQVRNVPVSELVSGYMRTQDYTQKTQQLGEQQRQFGDAFKLFSEARGQLETKLGQFVTERAGEFDQPINWAELAEKDAFEYARKRARFETLQDAKREQERLAGMRAQEDQARKAEVLQAGNEALKRIIPAWRDDASRAKLQQDLKAHAAALGYTNEELAQDILDPRLLVMLHDSLQYRRMSARKVTPAPAQDQPTLNRRGGTPAPQASREQQAANRAFSQKPSIDNALAKLAADRKRRK